jgi:hypothetical protein
MGYNFNESVHFQLDCENFPKNFNSDSKNPESPPNYFQPIVGVTTGLLEASVFFFRKRLATRSFSSLPSRAHNSKHTTKGRGRGKGQETLVASSLTPTLDALSLTANPRRPPLHYSSLHLPSFGPLRATLTQEGR